MFSENHILYGEKDQRPCDFDVFSVYSSVSSLLQFVGEANGRGKRFYGRELPLPTLRC